MAKVYAGQVKYINRELSEKFVSCLVQVYGWYDKEDPSTLHQRTPVMVDIKIPRDYQLADELFERSRLAIPAAGISEDAKMAKGRRGSFEIHSLIGIETRNITMLSKLTVQDDQAAYLKSGTSMVVAAASESVLSKLGKLVKSLF